MKKTCYLHIQQPCIYPGLIVLPYLWMQLETYYNQTSTYADDWEWIPPVYDIDCTVDDVISKLSQYDRLDVFGISAYIWDNKEEIETLQEWIKSNHPNCIIVLGGPHQDTMHRFDFFRKNKHVDVCCEPSGYGEVFWSTLLDQVSTGSVDMSVIPFALYPDSHRLVQKSTVLPNKRDVIWPIEVYKRHSAFIDEVQALACAKNYSVNVSIEFSRGCPYFCTFCEWGGTGTKVVFRPFDLIVKDLEFLIARKIQGLYIMDANFGIVARDVDIVVKIKELCQQYNHTPQLIILGYAKNDKRYVNQIIELCAELGVIDELNVSIQSLKESTLLAIKRKDAPWKQQIQDMQNIKVKYPKFSIRLQVILGLPEMTIDDVYEWFDAVHETNSALSAFMWHLLPSTPAFDLDYIAKYNLQYKHAKFLKSPNDGRVSINHIKDRSITTMPIVIATSTMSFDDFVETVAISALIDAGRNVGLFYSMMAKLNQATNIPFADLYRFYIRDVFKNKSTKTNVWYEHLTKQIITACNGDDSFVNAYTLPVRDEFMYDGSAYWSEMFFNTSDWLVEFGMWAKELVQKRMVSQG